MLLLLQAYVHVLIIEYVYIYICKHYQHHYYKTVSLGVAITTN